MWVKVWMISTLLHFLVNSGDCGDCDSNLITGPEGITDDFITASTTNSHCGTAYVRLDSPFGKAWCPETASNLDFLQIEFSSVSWLRSIITIGRGAHGMWVKTYHMKISNDGVTWNYVTNTSGSIKVFPANTDLTTSVEYSVKEPIIAKFIRIYPQTWVLLPAIRMEIKGCPYKTSSCWKAVLGSQDESLPIVHQTTTSNNGLCGRACHRYPTCENFLFILSSNICQLLGNNTSIDSLSGMADLNKKFYFSKYGVCASG